MFEYLAKADRPFSERTVSFYCAQIVSALQALHRNGFVYRDLKMENLLLDSEGPSHERERERERERA